MYRLPVLAIALLLFGFYLHGSLTAVEPVQPATAEVPVEQMLAKLTGRVIVLGKEGDTLRTSKRSAEEINPGGLVIIQVHDEGSEAVDIVQVESSPQLEHLGNVRGVGVEDGHPLMGGGYTWALFRARDEVGAAEISVSYKAAAHAGGKSRKETNYVNVVADQE